METDFQVLGWFYNPAPGGEEKSFCIVDNISSPLYI